MGWAARALARRGFEGPLTLGILGCGLILALALLGAALLVRPDARRVLWGLAWAEVTCLSTALLLTFALVTASRRRLAVPPSPADVGAWAGAVADSEEALLVTGATLGVVAVVLAAAVLVAALRLRTSALRAATLFFAACLVGVTALGVVRRATALMTLGFHGTPIERHEVAVTAAARLDQARDAALALTVVGALILAAAAAWDRVGEAKPMRRSAKLGSAAVLLLGIAAYRGTRAAAADAAHPILPHAPGEVDCPASPGVARSLPAAVTCDFWPDGPVLEIGAGSAMLDHVALTPEAIGRELADQRTRFVAMLGGPRRLPPLWVTLVAPATTPLAELVPYFQVLRDSLGRSIAIVGVTPERTLSSRTLGDLSPGPRCCATPIRFTAGGVPLSTFATWGDLARAAAARPDPLEVAPPLGP
jgi:hypothetical protein